MPFVSIAALLLCTAILASYAVRVAKSGRLRAARLGDAPGSALCPGWLVEAFYWIITLLSRSLIRARVPPDAITLLALACSLASMPLIAAGHFAAGALAVAAGGILDALDGLVARALGRASPAGAVLDAAVDRVADAAPFTGLALFYRGHAGTLIIPIAALVASSMVSYARAQADGHGLVLPNGLMRRHERIAYLLLALFLGPIVPAASFAPAIPCPATLVGIALIAAFSAIAAILLVARARRKLAQPSTRVVGTCRCVRSPASSSPPSSRPCPWPSRP